MKYTVEITETLQKQVSIEADTPEQAKDKVRDLYYSGEEVLGADYLIETEFEILHTINGSAYSIDQLRQKFRDITKISDEKFTDEHIYLYFKYREEL